MKISLKYLSDFWINLEMALINYEISFDVSWSKNCVITMKIKTLHFQ